MAYQILTDGGCDLPLQVLKDNQVAFAAFHFTIDGQDTKDDLGQSFDEPQFYEKIKAGVMPTTTQINVGEYSDFFRPYVKAGTPILYVGFSSGLSGSFASAEQAKALLIEEYPKAQIYLLDTLAASGGEGRLVLEAIRLKKAGTAIEDAYAWLNANRLRVQQWFTVDSLDYLYHGGRVSRTAAVLGTLLSIKPLLDVDTKGHLQMVSKVRSSKRALETLASKVVAALPADEKQPVLISTAGDFEAGNYVKAAILDKKPNANVTVGLIGPTISSHTGFGCVAAFVMGAAPRSN